MGCNQLYFHFLIKGGNLKCFNKEIFLLVVKRIEKIDSSCHCCSLDFDFENWEKIIFGNFFL